MLPAAPARPLFLIELSHLMGGLRVWTKLSLIGRRGEWLLNSSSDDKWIMQAKSHVAN